MKDMRRNMLKKIGETYTKRAVFLLLIVGVISSEIPYILSLFGKQPNEALGIAWITEVVAVIIGYMCKAYFETKQEQKQRLEEYVAKKEPIPTTMMSDLLTEDEINDLLRKEENKE